MNNTIKVILGTPVSSPLPTNPINLFGESHSFNPLAPIAGSIKEYAKDQTQEFIMGVFESIRDVIVDSIYSITLVGTGLCILFNVVGWKDGKRWAGILLLAHVLIRALLGGGV